MSNRVIEMMRKIEIEGWLMAESGRGGTVEEDGRKAD